MMKNRINKLPVSLRLSLWYTFFIGILLIALVLGTFFIFDLYLSTELKNNLIEDVHDMAEDIEEFEPVDDGVYYLLYDHNQDTFTGQAPSGFDIASPISIGQAKTLNSFIYYDIELENRSYVLRGVVNTSEISRLINTILLIIILLCPVILIVSIYGGYKITKNAFRLVEEVTDTSNEIQEEGDFSKRIDVGKGDDEITRMARSFNGMLDTLEKSYEREKQFSSDVSHELRTPISVILSESQYGLEFSDNLEESKESLTVIERQTQKMKKLLNQIMDLSKLDRDIKIDLERINYSVLLKETVEDVKILSEAININTNIEENIYIEANPGLISRLVDNLISNALKFTKDYIEVNLYEENEMAVLQVKDNGPGISKENINKIWDRFYQIDDSRNKNTNKGYGLGLSFVKRIVEAHGGNLEIESKEGKGSIFTVKVKIAK